MRKKIKSLL